MRQRSADEETRAGDMAAALVPFAAELVATVREYGRDDIEGVIYRHLGLSPGMGPETQTAIAAMVILAAMVDPDIPVEVALSWVTWDEHGYPPERAA